MTRLPDGRFHVEGSNTATGYAQLTGSLDEVAEFEGPFWGPKLKQAFEMSDVTLQKLEAIGLQA